MQFRLTRQAIDDLGLDVEACARKNADEYVSEHNFVRAFVERRSQNPEGVEATELPITKATVFNLHFGRLRGLTWHDADCDVVWLLGVGWHESGSIDDAYAILKQRDVAGTLMPTLSDYEDLELSLEETKSFVSLVARQVPEVVAKARNQHGIETTAVIADRIALGVVINVVVIDAGLDAEEIYVGFELPPREGPCELPSNPGWITTILAAILPESAELDEIEFDKQFPRTGGSRQYEITAYWSSI